MAGKTESFRVGMLLDFLEKQPDERFEPFCDVLIKSDQRGIVQKYLAAYITDQFAEKHNITKQSPEEDDVTSGSADPSVNDEELSTALKAYEYSEYQTILEGDQILASVTLEWELFVLRFRDKNQLEVYHCATMMKQRCIQLGPFPKWYSGIAACDYNRCIYISCPLDTFILKVDQSGSVTQFPVGGGDRPKYLSVTRDQYLLVCCSNGRRLKEFTSTGQLVREIRLQPDLTCPSHAIKLPSGQFIVCHGNDSTAMHRVCVVGTDGRTIKAYQTRRDGEIPAMESSSSMAVDNDDFIFVVEPWNRRVILLGPRLQYVKDVVTAECYADDWKPKTIFLNPILNQLLYVIENKDKKGRIRLFRKNGK